MFQGCEFGDLCVQAGAGGYDGGGGISGGEAVLLQAVLELGGLSGNEGKVGEYVV